MSAPDAAAIQGVAAFLISERAKGHLSCLGRAIDNLVRADDARVALQVTVALTSYSATTMRKRPGEDFHRLNVAELNPETGAVEQLAVEDMHPVVRTFHQMAVGCANQDWATVKALYEAQVQGDREEAARLLLTAVELLAQYRGPWPITPSSSGAGQ